MDPLASWYVLRTHLERYTEPRDRFLHHPSYSITPTDYVPNNAVQSSPCINGFDNELILDKLMPFTCFDVHYVLVILQVPLG